METFKQTLTVPPNHQLHFDVTLPANFPTGSAEVLLVFAPKAAPDAQTSKAELLKLSGSLKNSPHFSDDPLLIQKALRDEWKR